jgi:hypothetical protein
MEPITPEELDTNRAKAIELVSTPEDPNAVEPEADTSPEETPKEEATEEKASDEEIEARFATSFAALRRQQKQAAQLLATAKEERRVAREERSKLESEIELATLLRKAQSDPQHFFEAAKRAGVPVDVMADFLVSEKQPETRSNRELEQTKQEIQALKDQLAEREKQEREYVQRRQLEQMQAAEAQVGEKFVSFLDSNPEKYPALETIPEEDVRASAIYWAREEYKTTGSLPTAERLATFLEHHAMQRVQSTLAARRVKAAPKPSQQARPANGSIGESLSNDDASEAGVTLDDDSLEARKKRAVAILRQQNWRAPT